MSDLPYPKDYGSLYSNASLLVRPNFTLGGSSIDALFVSLSMERNATDAWDTIEMR